jgi:hypothetical protein
MTSSEVGLEMLRKWHTKNTLLDFVALAFSNGAPLREVRVIPEFPTAERIVLTFEDTGERLVLDKPALRLADADEEAPPIEAWIGKFSCFLFLKLTDERLFVLGERIPRV